MAWSTAYDGFWIATRYRDVVALAQDDDRFTTAKTFDPQTGHVEGGTALPPMPVERLVPAETDRPEWDGFRSLLNSRLSPRAVESFRQHAKTFADQLLDKVIEAGEMDLVGDFTNPLTAMVTLLVLGIPTDEWRTFADPLHALTSLSKLDPAYKDAVALAAVMDRRIDEEIERRKQTPRDDLIGHLLASRINGAPLRHEDIHQIIFNIVAGGVDTTASLTANAVVHLSRHPEQRRQLAANRDLLPKAREEFIRFFAPLHGTVRTAREDAVVANQQVCAGDRIYLMLASANRDADIFPDPDTVIIDRYPNRHIGFGAGMHRCVGSFLARMMFETMINAILDRIPDYEVIENDARRYPSISPINGWVSVPIRFAPGKPTGAVPRG